MSKVTLTPVIELGYYNQSNDMPPFAEKMAWSDDWLAYRKECMRLGGMPEPIAPEFPRTDFYSPEALAGVRLEWLIRQHISDHLDDPESICPFFGGYILAEDENTLMNPQCCGDLSDVIWWKHLCYDQEAVYYNGHPCPEITFQKNTIRFQCECDYEDFDFGTMKEFTVERNDLISAYEAMLPNLLQFKDSIAEVVAVCPDLSSLGIDIASTLTVNNIELGESDPSPSQRKS